MDTFFRFLYEFLSQFFNGFIDIIGNKLGFCDLGKVLENILFFIEDCLF